MRLSITPLILGTLVVLVLAIAVGNRNADGRGSAIDPPRPAPEFTQTDPESWLNGPVQRLADLRGQVLLIDIWTFDCWNCYRSFPWLNALEHDYGSRGLRVIGIHSPEFEHEHDPERVRAKIAEFGLHHPVMLDNDFAYWRALGNRFWPAYYLIDKRGRIRARYVGETHADSSQAKAIAARIEQLLDEPD